MTLGNFQKEKGFLASPGRSIQELTEKEDSKANRPAAAGLVTEHLQDPGTYSA